MCQLRRARTSSHGMHACVIVLRVCASISILTGSFYIGIFPFRQYLTRTKRNIAVKSAVIVAREGFVTQRRRSPEPDTMAVHDEIKKKKKRFFFFFFFFNKRKVIKMACDRQGPTLRNKCRGKKKKQINRTRILHSYGSHVKFLTDFKLVTFTFNTIYILNTTRKAEETFVRLANIRFYRENPEHFKRTNSVCTRK